MGKEVVTEEFEDNVPIDEQMGYDERIRLLYVACTRACDHLVLSLHRVDRKSEPKLKRSRHNSEVLLAGMGDAVESLRDLSGEPTPLAAAPAATPTPPPPFAAWDAQPPTAPIGRAPGRERVWQA